jgi:membrane protein DedA with SNARE-associated domain
VPDDVNDVHRFRGLRESDWEKPREAATGFDLRDIQAGPEQQMQWFIEHLSSMTPLGAYLWLTGILLLCGLGLPIPEDVSLIAAGYFSYKGVLYLHKAFAVCFFAVLAGDTFAFFLGRWFGQRMLASPWMRRYFTPKRQRRVRAYFRKFGSKVVFLGRFTPGLRFSIFFSAGMLHLRPSVFFIYDTLAAMISVPVLVYLAWFFGGQIDHVVAFARHTEHGILVALAIVAGVVLFRAYRKRRRRQMLSTPVSPPRNDNAAGD